MRLLVMVMEDRKVELAPVRSDPEKARQIAEAAFSAEILDVVEAGDGASDDYWMTLPDALAMTHLIAPGTIQGFKPGIGLAAAGLGSAAGGGGADA